MDIASKRSRLRILKWFILPNEDLHAWRQFELARCHWGSLKLSVFGPFISKFCIYTHIYSNSAKLVGTRTEGVGCLEPLGMALVDWCVLPNKQGFFWGSSSCDPWHHWHLERCICKIQFSYVWMLPYEVSFNYFWDFFLFVFLIYYFDNYIGAFWLLIF